ncbi:GNAT family N-acetyltransferase [Kitasatospora sp. NPDC008115]|uniref:GNAT family N-acetyltransferase n=1 Tax=Kitasatospora sp. NPDC008115 TaxID=3364022 RepID=UPI0036F078A3
MPEPDPQEDEMTTTAVADNPEKSRYEITSDGEPAGFAEYHRHEGEIAFIHTEIDPRFGGQGLGGILARAVLDDARANDLAVLPYCPFIRGWLTRHPEYHDLVPAAQHERFGL